MAIGLIKKNSEVALKIEAVEGVQEALTDGDDYILVLEDGLEMVPGKELISRNILVPSIGVITPRTSTRSVVGSFPVEWAGAGDIADQTRAPDYFVLLESMLGPGVTQAGTTTTGVGTTTTMEITGNILAVGDFVTIETAGEFHNAFITIAGDPTVTFSPPSPSAIGTGVAVSASIKYASTNSGQPTFSGYVFWGGEVQEVGTGMRVNSMGLESFETGLIPTLAFSSEGLTSERTIASSPFAPIVSSAPPPVALGAVVLQGDVCIDLNSIDVSIENTMSFLTSVKSKDGKISSRFTQRNLSGNMNPFLDDATTANFWDKFVSDEPFAVIITLGIEGSTPGEFVPGSSVGMYLPQNLLSEDSISDLDQLLVEQLAFIPNAGQSGTEVDIFMGYS